MIRRRDLMGLGPAALCGWALAGHSRAAIPQDGRRSTRRWLRRHDEVARGLAFGWFGRCEC